MVDQLEMAKQYVQEMLEKRDDIAGAFVAGSVARGEADEDSDIDLLFIVEGGEGEGFHRGGFDTWRDGVYVKASLVPVGQFANAEKVLLDPIATTGLNDALIPYDPSGTFTRIQEEVRAAFMEPGYLGIRVHPIVRSLREEVEGLVAACADAALLWRDAGDGHLCGSTSR